MSLITLFSAPKAFTDPVARRLQRNAIGSWTRLPDVDTLLLGEEDGLAEAASELGAHLNSKVARNPNGVPLVSSMLELAREASSSPLLCIINADIILTSDFVDAAKQVASVVADPSAGATPAGLKPFVLLSRRWDLDVPEPLEFAGAGRNAFERPPGPEAACTGPQAATSSCSHATATPTCRASPSGAPGGTTG